MRLFTRLCFVAWFAVHSLWAAVGDPMLQSTDNAFTFGDGANANVTVTYDNSGTDVVLTIATNAFNVSTGNIQQGGTQVVLESRTLTGGNGIETLGDLSSNRTVQLDLNATLDGAGSTSSLSGMEFTATGEVALLQGCSDGEVLKWEDTGATWDCGTDDGTNPLTIASPTEVTLATGSVDVSACGANTICHWTIDTQSDAASDDWTGVTCVAGSVHYFSAASDARTVVAQLQPGPDFSLDDIDDYAGFVCSATDTFDMLTRENAG